MLTVYCRISLHIIQEKIKFVKNHINLTELSNKMDNFTYVGSIHSVDDGAIEDINVRIYMTVKLIIFIQNQAQNL